jgi:GcrA cell cycle regulator
MFAPSSVMRATSWCYCDILSSCLRNRSRSFPKPLSSQRAMQPRTRAWTTEDDERLRALIAKGASAIRAAAALKCPIAKVRAQARKIGYPFPTIRVSDNSSRSAEVGQYSGKLMATRLNSCGRKRPQHSEAGTPGQKRGAGKSAPGGDAGAHPEKPRQRRALSYEPRLAHRQAGQEVQRINLWGWFTC